jgi:SPP1 gp7 family putative phage head morphogenesis protein
MDWDRSNRIEQEYRRSITAIYNDILQGLKGETDPETIARKLRDISKNPSFHEYAVARAAKMATQTNKSVSSTWRAASKEVGRGSELYDNIMRSLTENPGAYYDIIQANAAYITSVPAEAADWIIQKVQEESLKGRRSSDIMEDILQGYPDMLKTKAKLIARTEVSKAQTALTQSRAKRLGLDWYIWRTSEDGRVRKSHDHMKGVLIRWSDPPDPEKLSQQKDVKSYGRYHAGEIFNCRCYPEPIVGLDFVDFPAKVYYGGKIVRMTRSKFERLVA